MIVTVFGAKGKMGKSVVKLLEQRKHKVIPVDVDTPVVNDKTDVVIDFSTASATGDVVSYCIRHKVPLVSGVTGRNQAQLQLVETLQQIVQVVAKNNFAESAEITCEISKLVASRLPTWDCDVVEHHRKGKKDSPSGTAITLASAISQGRINTFGASTTIHSIRAGNEIGTHTVIFSGNDESITIIHKVNNSDVFALGAVLTAEKLVTTETKLQ